MDRSEVAYLVAQMYEPDLIGQMITKETKKEIFCSISSVSGQERMEAGREGITAEYRLTMFQPDYEGEKIVELEGERYGVYRTYQAKNDTIELYLEVKAGI